MVSKNVKEGIEYRLATLDVMIAVTVGNTGISVERERERGEEGERGMEEGRNGGREGGREEESRGMERVKHA